MRRLPRAKTPPFSADSPFHWHRWSLKAPLVTVQHLSSFKFHPVISVLYLVEAISSPTLFLLSCLPYPQVYPTSIPRVSSCSPLTFSDNALHTDDTAQEAGGKGPRRDVLGAEAALQAYVELLVLLGIRSINGGHEILQGPLEGSQLLKGIAQEAAETAELKKLDPQN